MIQASIVLETGNKFQCSRWGRSKVKEKARRLAVIVLMIAATFAAVMGYNFNGNRFFVALPFIAGVGLVILARTRPVEVTDEDELYSLKLRKRAVMQFIVSGVMVSGFIIYNAVEGDWGKVTGFSIMLTTILILFAMAYAFRKWAPVEGPKTLRKSKARSDCDELRGSGRLYADEELNAGDPRPGGD
jgi:uncharacterized membrane protein